ncbi:MAG: PaaI family thioesterase [Candidatus Eisenbacteria bacterium]
MRESLGRQTFMTTLGARLVHVAPGEVDLAFDARPDLLQQNGFVHAGVLSAVADSANGYAAFTLAAAGTDVLAVEFKINLLAPARAPSFVARGRVLRAGRTLTVGRADVFAAPDGDRDATLVATMQSTIIVLPRRE